MTKHKDPNEFLMAGNDKDFLFSWINKKKYVPEYDTSTVDGYMQIYNDGADAEYIPTGLEEFDSKALGLVQGVLTVLQAPEGIGKTELVRYFEHHLIKNYPDVPFATCHLEESKQRSLLGLVSYDKGKNLTRKELVTEADDIEGSIKRLTGSENVHLFTIGTDEDPFVLIERIKYYANICECKYVFFEPIQDIAHQRADNTMTTEQFLTKMSVQLARVASETGCGIIVVAHENDDGLVRDCRMIPKQAAVVVQLSRDMKNPDPEIANITTLTLLKNRPSSLTGFAGQVKFDPKSFTLEEYT
jgi:predicted ATP-dependent serine protease